MFGLPADFKEGIIFSTYATLVSSVNRSGGIGSTKSSRLQQLVDWCGGHSFDGCMVFDECHKAKNFLPVSRIILFPLLLANPGKEKTISSLPTPKM